MWGYSHSVKCIFSFLSFKPSASRFARVNVKQHFSEVSVWMVNVIFMCNMSEHLRENVGGQLISAALCDETTMTRRHKTWFQHTAADRHQLGYGGLRRINTTFHGTLNRWRQHGYSTSFAKGQGKCMLYRRRLRSVWGVLSDGNAVACWMVITILCPPATTTTL